MREACGRRRGGALLRAVLLAGLTALPVLRDAHAQTADTYYDDFPDSSLRGTSYDPIDEEIARERPAVPPYLPGGDDPEAEPLVPSYQTLTAPDPDAGAAFVDDLEPVTLSPIGAIDAAPETAAPVYGRINLPAASVDGLRARPREDDGEAPGIRLGTFILRPTLTQKIMHERDRYGDNTDRRTYSETVVEGTLQSDWSRHRLTVTGDGTIQKNISGEGQEDPSASLDAVLDLDLTSAMQGQLRAGYDFYREDRTDPNAIANATAQAGVHTFTGAASLTRELGRLRGTATADVSRTLYGDAELIDGTVISGDERDNRGYGITGRIGYEVSPALIPFVQASLGRTDFDQEIDSAGFERSATSYGLRGGVELPLGEKLSGEVSVGYLNRDIDDPLLEDIDAFAIDGLINWSPQRGTNVTARLRTDIGSSTTPGESGWVTRAVTLGIKHELRSNLVARLTGAALRRNFRGPAAPADETTLALDGELDWSINRYLSLITEAGYERTTQAGVPDSDIARVGLGLRLKR